jgi:hypothetical protein
VDGIPNGATAKQKLPTTLRRIIGSYKFIANLCGTPGTSPNGVYNKYHENKYLESTFDGYATHQ